MNIYVKTLFFLKKLMPRGLFGRSLIILLAPIILIQLTTTYIFIDRHFDKVTQLLANDIAGKLAGAVDVLLSASDLQHNFLSLQNHIWQRFDLKLMIPVLENNQMSGLSQKLPYKEKTLIQSLKAHLFYPFDIFVEEEDLFVRVKTSKGTFIFKDQLKHLYPRTTSILLWWFIITPLFFILISIIFLKNQIRPLRKLSEIVDDFGRGFEGTPLKPSGSLEVRNVSQAFNVMRDRIKRQMTRRTEMLAGVSHDLRTPLTRMELQLALMPPSADILNLQDEIKVMARMIEEFLAFAKGEEGEEKKKQDFNQLLKEIIGQFNVSRIHLKSPLEPLYLCYRQNAMTRCLSNIISNAMKYAGKLEISYQKNPNEWEILFDDDGPGILEKDRENVFRPFFRLESSRNSETGGVGLGLAVTRDIIHSHGGTINLAKSPLGGLRVIVQLPL